MRSFERRERSTACASRSANRTRFASPVSGSCSVCSCSVSIVQHLLADVLDVRHEVVRLPALVAHQRDAQERPDVVPRGVPVALSQLVSLALVRDQAMQLLEVRVQVVGVGERLERGPEQLLLGRAENAGERCVDAREAPVQRDQRLADRSLVEGVAEALLGVAQLERGVALGGDVATDAEVSGKRAVGRANGRDGERHGQLHAVAAHERPVARVGVLVARPESEHALRRHAELFREADELVRVVEDRRVLAPDQILRAVPEHALGAAVEHGDQPVGIGADDRVLRGGVEHRLERVARRDRGGLAGAQRLLGRRGARSRPGRLPGPR